MTAPGEMREAIANDKDVLVGHGRHARVLIVEDEPVSALILKRFFEQEGIRVDHATDGKKALDLYRRNRYRMVISDWFLPQISGLELCRQFRNEEFNYVYFILCSTDQSKGSLKEAYDAGIDDFLQKPFNPEALVQRLQVARRILQIENSLQTQRLEMEHKGEALSAMNQSLMHASRRFEELFNGLPVACFTLDRTGLIHEWNRQSEKDFGIPTHVAFQRSAWDVLGLESDGFWSRDTISAIFSGESLEDLDWQLKMPSNETRHFVGNIFGLRNLHGELIGAICANLDITERKKAEQRIDEQMVTINLYAKELQRQKTQLEKANRRLEHLALTDGMTGLLNHRGFQEELERAYDRHMRLGLPLSLVLMDVDNFKLFNDTFGHQGGDAVLQRFGQLLQSSTRRHEPAARYGGEEFAVILEGADAECAIRAAERFREAIQKRRWPFQQITASFGVATVHDGAISREELIRRSDIALYASKRNGKDRVTHYSASEESKAA
jgi:two-component system, cell cycle response regulator